MTDQPITTDLLNDLGALHTRTRVSPLPQDPDVFGWQAQAGALAAGFARALHALHQTAPEQAQQLARWWEGPFGEGPDSYRHTMWLERHVAGGDRAVTKQWVEEGRKAAQEANAAQVQEVEPEAIHGYFSLSYANFLVVPRSFLQSMPDWWQTQFVALLERMDEAFAHVPKPDCYKVEAATEHIVNELTQAQLKLAGIVEDPYRGETPPEGLSGEDLDEWHDAHEAPEGPAYYRDGEELDPHERVLLPAVDPVPHYNRGRTRIEPQLHSCGNCEGVDPQSCLTNPERTA